MSYRPLSPSERFAILMRDGFACGYCGARAPEARLHVDHIIARANGGTNDPGNLITACELCNLGKSDSELFPAWRRQNKYASSGLVASRLLDRFGGNCHPTGLKICMAASFEGGGRGAFFLRTVERSRNFDDAVERFDWIAAIDASEAAGGLDEDS